MVEKGVIANFFHHFREQKTSSEIRGKSGKSCQNQLFSTIQAVLEAQIVEKVGLTTFSTICMIPKTSSTIRGKSGLANIFHDNFHFFWWFEASKPAEAIVPQIMEIMETGGFTNNLQDFCYQIHGNYWFQGRKHSKNLGQWGGYHIYIYPHTYIYLYM